MYRSTLTVLLGLFIQQVHAQTLAMEKDAPLTGRFGEYSSKRVSR